MFNLLKFRCWEEDSAASKRKIKIYLQNKYISSIDGHEACGSQTSGIFCNGSLRLGQLKCADFT